LADKIGQLYRSSDTTFMLCFRLLQSIFQSLCDVEVTLIPPDTRMPCSEVVSHQSVSQSIQDC